MKFGTKFGTKYDPTRQVGSNLITSIFGILLKGSN